MISIIDVGVGNFNSASNMIKKLGFQVELINDYDLISKSDTLILPGVGRFDIFIEKIFNKKIDIAINNAIMNGAKILGICVGMQVLLDYSEEGSAKGLGLIEGDVKKFDNSSNKKLKIPHMGWNNVFFNNSNKIFDGLGVNKFILSIPIMLT